MEGSALTSFALIFMLLSMGAVTGLMIYCFYRIVRGGTSPGYGSAAPAGGGAGPGESGPAEPDRSSGPSGPRGG